MVNQQNKQRTKLYKELEMLQKYSESQPTKQQRQWNSDILFLIKILNQKKYNFYDLTQW